MFFLAATLVGWIGGDFGFVKFKYFNGRLRDQFCISVPNFVKIGQTILRRYRDLCDFQDGGRSHIGFSKIRNFNGRSTVRGSVRHRAKFHQNR